MNPVKKSVAMPVIDEYINQSPAFAQPILSHLREVVHAACPDAAETMKWSRPHFEYKGLPCAMSAFKAHCGFGFWKGALMFPGMSEREAMGHFGRITKVADLPSRGALAALVTRAMRLNDERAEMPARVRSAAPPVLVVPDYFFAALKEDRAAQAAFDAATPGLRREYVAWLNEATRMRAEGKERNWKNEKCWWSCATSCSYKHYDIQWIIIA